MAAGGMGAEVSGGSSRETVWERKSRRCGRSARSERPFFFISPHQPSIRRAERQVNAGLRPPTRDIGEN
jgi:hypothetical protein